MAIVTAVPIKTQSGTAMKKVLDYVMRPEKTRGFVSGQNCVPETAFIEFMTTKEQYRKAHGVFYKQYVQSFKPDCGATPEQIHQMGIAFAKQFEGFEVIIATHIDTDHWHNHFIVNSVNFETGLKIQINEKGLERMRQQSDEICRRFGLEVLAPYQKPKQRVLNQREYRAAMRGDSWKMKLLSAIEKAMAASNSKVGFIRNMESLGYGVKWAGHRKYITYTTPDGQKCRDNRLYDEKYLKSNMEVHFGGLEKTDGNKSRYERNTGRAVSAHPDWSKTRTMERANQTHSDGGNSDSREHGAHIKVTNTRQHKQPNATGNPAAQYRDNPELELSGETVFGNSFRTDDGNRAQYPENRIETGIRHDGEIANTGFVADKLQNQMGADWNDIARDAAALADSIDAMVENPKPEISMEHRTKNKKRKWEMEI